MVVQLSRIALAAILVVSSFAANADEKPIEIATVKHDGPVSFGKEILPILRKKCLACHNATEAESDLVLETPASILKGGSLGPAVVAGKSMDSLLLLSASRNDEPYMPPADNDVSAAPLTPDELGLLKLWIDQGAKADEGGAAEEVSWQALPQGVNPIYAVAISPDGHYAAAGRANQIFIYHIPSKREIGRLTDQALIESGMYDRPGVAHLDLVQSLAFSPDNRTLASGGYRNVKIWRRDDHSTKLTLEGVAGPPQSTDVSPDGKLAAVGQENGEVKLFNLLDGKATHTLKGHTGAVTGVSFSADGAKLLSGGNDKTFRLWNVADGAQVGDAIETPSEITAVAIVSADKQLATAHQDNDVRVWDIGITAAPPEEPKEGEEPKPPAPVKELKGHTQPVTSLAAFPADRTQLLSGSTDATMRHWDIGGGNQVRSFAHGGPVTGVAARPDGQRFASVSSNNVGKLWNANGQQITELRGDYQAKIRVDDLTRSVSVAKRHIDIAKKLLDEGQKRKTSEEENLKKSEEAKTKAEAEFKTKDEASKKPLADKEAADKVLEEADAALAKAEEAKTVAEAALKTADEALKAAQADRDTKEGDEKAAAEKVVADLDAKRKEADDAKKAADAEFAKLTNEQKQADAKVKQLAAPAQKAKDERDAAERAMQAAVRSVERGQASVKKAAEAIPGMEAVVKEKEESHVAETKLLEEAKAAAPASEQPIMSVAFSPTGGVLATGGEDKVIYTWDGETGEAVDAVRDQPATVKQLVFTPTGDILSVTDSAAALWNGVPQWRLVRTIGSVDSGEQFVDRVTALNFSPDGAVLAAGGGEPSRSGEIKLWNVEDGSLIRAIEEPHSDTVLGLEFSPDGQQIASSAADRFMKVFNVADGSFVRSFEGHTHHVLDVSWSADQELLATCGADNVVKIWQVRTGDQQRTITGYGKEVTSIQFVADSNNVVASCGDKNIHYKRADNGGNVRSFSGGQDFMFAVASPANGKLFVAGGQDSVLRVWQSDNGQVIATFEPPTQEQTADSSE